MMIKKGEFLKKIKKGEDVACSARKLAKACLVPNFFCKIRIVPLSFVFDKYYLIMY